MKIWNLDMCWGKGWGSVSKHCIHWFKPSQSCRHLFGQKYIFSNLCVSLSLSCFILSFSSLWLLPVLPTRLCLRQHEWMSAPDWWRWDWCWWCVGGGEWWLVMNESLWCGNVRGWWMVNCEDGWKIMVDDGDGDGWMVWGMVTQRLLTWSLSRDSQPVIEEPWGKRLVEIPTPISIPKTKRKREEEKLTMRAM